MFLMGIFLMSLRSWATSRDSSTLRLDEKKNTSLSMGRYWRGSSLATRYSRMSFLLLSDQSSRKIRFSGL